MWIRLLIILTLALPSALFGQTTEPNAATPAHAAGITNEARFGGIFGADEDSSKFNEYRDLDDGLRLFSLRVLDNNTGSASYFEAVGANLGGRDQELAVRAGRFGTWSASLGVDWLPHRLSNHAFSPYSYAGRGLFTVPGVVGILTDTADGVNFRASDMLENDRRIAAYLDQNLRAYPAIGTDNERYTFDFAWAPSAAFEARFGAAHEIREGEKITYGPLGDRPPRTMNVELAEPIDYNETTLQFELAWAHRLFDVAFELYAPEFKNGTDTMRWQSMYFGPDSNGALDYNNDIILAGDAIARRAVSTFGQRALPPDNRFVNATLSYGMDTAMNGRLSAVAALGTYRQNETLLPYSWSSLTTNWNSTAKLPRLSAEAEMNTTLLDLQYVFSPLAGLRIRPFVRMYELENDIPEDRWWYVTQDTASNTSGSATYKNKRVNLAYEFGRDNIGVETTFQRRGATLGLRVEQESVDREYREANTDELIVRASASFRPMRRLTLRGRYTFGDRDADGYDFAVGTRGYWYTPADAGTDQDNPGYSFTNHPDMRRYDVSDRQRNELDLSANFAATTTLSFGASFSAREHDFDSDVAPVQPLAGTAFAGANDVTPGVQLGLLNQDTQRLSLDANWNPSERWGVSAFVSLDTIDLLQKGMAYNEMTRTSAQAPLLASAGQAWTNASNIWTADHEDQTTTYGVAFNYVLIPDRLTLGADYSFSEGTVDILYSGYGSTQPLNTTYYAWRTPPTAERTQNIANLTLDYELPRGFTIGFRYLFDDYEITDWMEDPQGGWIETVGSEYFTRDSTRDNRWGNRLVRLGDYLAPTYSANAGFVTLGYRW